MPEQYEWSVWLSNQNHWIPHSYVFRCPLQLQAGTQYHFQTRNLRSWFNGPNADPVLYLVQGTDIVDYNDDYNGLASEIIYTPTQTGTHTLVMRAYATATPGYCDLYQGIGGAPPALLAQNVYFGGTYVRARWKLGEWFETGPGPPPAPATGGTIYFETDAGFSSGDGVADDPYLFLIYPTHDVGSKLFMDDDSGPGNHAKIVPPSAGEGAVILGSYSLYSDGQCLLALVGQSYKAPWLSPAPWASTPHPVDPSPSVKKYLKEVKRLKPALEKLDPAERDEKVLDVQRTMLSERQIRRQINPAPALDAELSHRQQDFLKRYKRMEKKLEKVPYSERATTLTQLKREALGREYAEPEEFSS